MAKHSTCAVKAVNEAHSLKSLIIWYAMSMNTEIEVKFVDIDHDAMRHKLRALGAELKQPMRLMRRVVFHNDKMDQKDAFLRVRDEGFRTTLTYKQFDEHSVDGAKEHEVVTSSFEEMISILNAIGLEYDAYQETKRENWELDGAEIMLDEWPWINPYIEIEGKSEQAIKEVAEKLGLDWSRAIFGAVTQVYRHQSHTLPTKAMRSSINNGIVLDLMIQCQHC